MCLCLCVCVCVRERRIFLTESMSNTVRITNENLFVICSFRISSFVCSLFVARIGIFYSFAFVIPPSFIRSISTTSPSLLFITRNGNSFLSMRELLFLFASALCTGGCANIQNILREPNLPPSHNSESIVEDTANLRRVS